MVQRENRKHNLTIRYFIAASTDCCDARQQILRGSRSPGMHQVTIIYSHLRFSCSIENILESTLKSNIL